MAEEAPRWFVRKFCKQDTVDVCGTNAGMKVHLGYGVLDNVRDSSTTKENGVMTLQNQSDYYKGRFQMNTFELPIL